MNPVEDYIYKQQSNQRDILIFFHELLINQPGIKASLKWGIPMYSGNKIIAYLNKDKKSNGVYLCFYNGIQLIKNNPILEVKGRKMVASIFIENISNICYDKIANCIQDAIELDN